MLGDIVSCWTRIVSRMSTASFEYGFSRLSGIGPGASAVTRDRSAIASYRNAWWTRISCQLGELGVGGRARRQPAHELAHGGLDLAPEQQPAVARERLADAVGELADDAEVDVADRVAGEHEDVGRVQVGVEVAEHEHLVEHVPVEVAARSGRGRGRTSRAASRYAWSPSRLATIDLDQRDALDQLGRQHARRRVVAVDAGDPLVPVAPRVLAEQDGLARLDQVVELVRRPARELVDDRRGSSSRRTAASSRGARSRCT